MHNTAAPNPSTTSGSIPSVAAADPAYAARRLRTGIGAAALLASTLMVGACGQTQAPLNPQPAGAAERPITSCRAVSYVPNAQYGPLLHRQDPGFTTPIENGARRPLSMLARSVLDCPGDAAGEDQQTVAPNPGDGPIQHRVGP